MADQKSSIPAPSAGLSIFLLVMFANLFARQMSPNRISGTAVPNTNSSGLQQTPSQLWRDPLGVTYAAMLDYSATIDRASKDPSVTHRNDFSPTAPVDADRIARYFTSDVGREPNAPRKPAAPDSRVLMVVVPGSPFPESQETRLQTRYAVATALSVNHFMPEDPGDLGICSVKADPKEPATSEILVPFEFYRSEKSERPESRVLVAWIDDNHLRANTLPVLLRLASSLAPAESVKQEQFALIGPPDSDLLRSLIVGRSACAGTALPFRVISPWATVADVQKDAKCALTKKGFHSTIGADDGLVDLLAEELRLRLPRYFAATPSGFLGFADGLLHGALFVPRFESMSPEAKTLDIAIVYEGESSYGRQWCEALTNSLKCPENDTGFAKLRDGADVNISTSMQYFRGIEGIDIRELPRDANQSPRFAGSSQLDYVRRLSLRLEGKRLSAIGILGTQVEDKLAIIHELRPRFPDAVFFTTDLDAHLLPATAGRDTMNLVVASQFGLESPSKRRSKSTSDGSKASNQTGNGEDDGPSAATSFRSSYQVSTFRAVCSALRSSVMEPAPPRLFEIGRTTAHPLAELSLRRETSDDGVAHAMTPEPEAKISAGLSPIDRDERQSLRTWLLRKRTNSFGGIAAFLVIAGCISAHRGWVREARRLWSSGGTRGLKIGFVISMVALLVHVGYLCDLCVTLDDSVRGQPLYFSEGISPWPTMALHALGTIVAVIGIFFAAARIVEAKTSVTLDEGELLKSPFEPGEADHLRQAFESFRRRLGLRRVLWWVGVLAALYYVMTGFMFRLIGSDIPPTRGIDVLVADRWYLFWAIIPFNLNLFLILYVSRATHQLLEELRSAAAHRLRSPPASALLRDPCGGCDAIAIAAMDVTRHVTKNVGSLIWTPAATLFLLFVSRSTLFTRWTWPPALVVTFLVCALLIVVMSSHVRSSAHKLRNELVQILGRIRATAGDASIDRLIQNTISYMTAEKTGAFAPLLDHPVVQAGLLPILGLMLSSTLDLLPKFLGAS